MTERLGASSANWRACLVLLALSVPFMTFTLEDTWIFLAIARDFPSPDGLRGATSLSWGLLSVLAERLSGQSDATWALKGVSAGCWVLAGLCTVRAASAVRPDVSSPRVALVFGLMSATIWSWSGMDTAWGMLWASICLWLLAVSRVGLSHRPRAELALAVLLGLSYLVRPELLWVGPLWLLWIRARTTTGRWALLCAIVAAMLLLSGLTYKGLTGSFTPTSSSKIGVPGLVTLISLAWFFLQVLPLAISTRGGVLKGRHDEARALVMAVLSVVSLRLLEHGVLGGIDHRPLAVLVPCLVLVWGLAVPERLSRRGAALLWLPLALLYALNADNARWYAERTAAVHQQVVQALAALPVDQVVGTDEVGLVSYKLGVARVLDHHHLIGRGLSSPADADVLVFTGELYREAALQAGFRSAMTYCFDARPTVYVRSVGLTPRAYCKTLYQR